MDRTNHPKPDWDHRSTDVTNDQRAAYDAMRNRCPVAYSDAMGWSVFRHQDVMRVLLDHDTFSNQVSRHLSVPNGMDPPEHTVYRQVIVPYFSGDRMRAFEPACREIVATLAAEIATASRMELMGEFALVAAVRIHTAFLGWPPSTQGFLIDWINRSSAATRAQDRPAQVSAAEEFERFIAERLEERRQSSAAGDQDVTASLMHEEVNGRLLSDAEVASILRNWTAGEIGTMASAIGILVHYLAENQDLQEQLRQDSSMLPAAIDEISRLHGPLVTNRRVTTRPVELGGRAIEAHERITLNWVAANRDPDVFEHPEEFDLTRNPDDNLLYGAGIHVCPGAPLARMELRIAMEELLARTSRIELDPERLPALAVYPSSGYTTLPVVIR